MPSTAALKPAVVVMHGTDFCTAAVRMSQPSWRVPRPTGVLIIRSISPEFINSTIVFSPIGPVPSECLRTRVHGICLEASPSAVPPVARIRNPIRERSCAAWIPCALSLSAKLTNTVPFFGSAPKALICDLA